MVETSKREPLLQTEEGQPGNELATGCYRRDFVQMCAEWGGGRHIVELITDLVGVKRKRHQQHPYTLIWSTSYYHLSFYRLSSMENIWTWVLLISQ